MKKLSLFACTLLFVVASCSNDDDDDPVKSSEKSIIEFSFLAGDNDMLDSDIDAQIDEDTKTITAELPENTPLTALTPTLTTSSRASVNPENKEIVDFSQPVVYTVTAEDGTTAAYTVTVTAKLSDAKEIMSFTFLASDNDVLSKDILATIDNDQKAISAELPMGTSPTALKPTLVISAKATVNPNGEETQDFSEAVTYTVTAEDGSTVEYTVTISVEPSDAKEIASFVFLAADNEALVGDITATVDEQTKTIEAKLPFDVDLGSLKPTLVLSDGASVDPENKVETDFTGPVTYTVTAADGSTQSYTVTLATGPITDRDVLIAWYRANPGNTLSWDFSKDISEWEGIELREGRVFSIVLKNKNLPVVTPLISHLSELVILGLAGNGITTLPAEIGDLEKLASLDMTGNELTELPSEIGKLKELLILVFHNNKITALPQEIGNLKKLIELNLAFNDLRSLPAGIGGLAKLESLTVYGSRNLESVPAELGNLKELVNLDLGYCNLSSIPKEIGELSKLVSLGLEENKLTGIPPEIGNLDSLASLELQENLLTELPVELAMLDSLIVLYVHDNQLTVIPKEICDLDNDSEFIFSKDPEAVCEE